MGRRQAADRWRSRLRVPFQSTKPKEWPLSRFAQREKRPFFVGFVKDAFTTFALFISFALLRDAWAAAPMADARGGARQQGPMGQRGLLCRMTSCIKTVWHLHK